MYAHKTKIPTVRDIWSTGGSEGANYAYYISIMQLTATIIIRISLQILKQVPYPWPPSHLSLPLEPQVQFSTQITFFMFPPSIDYA